MTSTVLDKKIVSISAKRQITIPQKFFKLLNFQTEAECILRNSEIIIKPLMKDSDEEFSDLILADLINEGYSGEKLLEEFKIRRSQIKTAVSAMIEDADAAAEGRAVGMTMEEVFGSK